MIRIPTEEQMTLEFFKSFYDKIPIRLSIKENFHLAVFKLFSQNFVKKADDNEIPVKILTKISYKKELALPIKA